ncbi:hypothetical protein HDC94_000977 [Leifsonia sp. AK011]|uniref:hypothetical protein n=1 Tax=Leifsonia sp. AK011 TaxID=2723075 RepID=UPI0017BB30CB|nr:hypothetical protein [Leifsonia sp. AK011]NYF09821.1 hypothetical protein [Leifsonia sp. AK011]
MIALPTWDVAGAAHAGFEGFVTFEQLATADVPPRPGVYLVLRPALPPIFLPLSPAGRFKAREPSVSTDRLEREWLHATEVIYIGKASARKTRADGLRKRLDEYRRFGAGEPVGHWGGRLIWQLADSRSLLVAWKESDSPHELESQLIADFVQDHGRLPFANLRH